MVLQRFYHIHRLNAYRVWRGDPPATILSLFISCSRGERLWSTRCKTELTHPIVQTFSERATRMEHIVLPPPLSVLVLPGGSSLGAGGVDTPLDSTFSTVGKNINQPSYTARTRRAHHRIVISSRPAHGGIATSIVSQEEVVSCSSTTR